MCVCVCVYRKMVLYEFHIKEQKITRTEEQKFGKRIILKLAFATHAPSQIIDTLSTYV